VISAISEVISAISVVISAISEQLEAQMRSYGGHVELP